MSVDAPAKAVRSDLAEAEAHADFRKGARITGAERQRLVSSLRAEYENGRSIRALAQSTGRSYGFIHRLLVDAEVKLRGRGGATRTKRG